MWLWFSFRAFSAKPTKFAAITGAFTALQYRRTEESSRIAWKDRSMPTPLLSANLKVE